MKDLDDCTVNEAVVTFLTYLEASQFPTTAKTYATGLRHFQRYLAAMDFPPSTTPVSLLKPSDVVDFVPWLYDYLLKNVAGGQPAKIKQATKANYLAAVGRFFEWLVVEKQLLAWTINDYDVLRKAMRRAAKVNSRDELSLDKLPSTDIVTDLLAEVHKPLILRENVPPGEQRRQHLAWLRNIAIIETFISSGMRVGELVRLERSHLLYDVHGAIIKHGKGNKERETLLSEQAWTAIQAYLIARADGNRVRIMAALPVFARHDRRAGPRILPLTTRSIENILLDLSGRAGILERFHLTPHSLRHFFATEFLSETGSLALTQYALGHSNPGTTRIYAQTKREDYRRAYREAFG